MVSVEAFARENGTQLLGDLRRLGFDRGATQGTLVSGRLPISAIREAARLPSLRGMMPSYARVQVGSVDSEADTSHLAFEARESFGVDGRGQKICALSDSYNQNENAETSASDDVQSGDLPGANNPEGRTTPVDVLRDDIDDGTDEGRAMLQLMHDIAPGADLGFHTAFGGLSIFAQGIRDLADAGCTVIVDDVIFLAEPFFQDGPVSLAVNDVVNTQNVAYFSSAGNNGQNSYEAPFRASSETGPLADSSVAHNFAPQGQDTRQQITISVGGNFEVLSLQWTDPSALSDASSQGPDTDLDIALLTRTDSVVAQSAIDNVNDVPTPFESLQFNNDGSVDTDGDGVADSTFSLAIEKAQGPDPEQVKYVYTGQNFQVEEFDTLGPTVFGHAMAEGARSTAAAVFVNTAEFNDDIDSGAVLNAFSSKGGIDIRFNQNGNELSTPESRQKPDLSGTDGISNTFFGADATDDGTPNFLGTSAAAPNIAAIAGLIRQADPSLGPIDVYDRLESTAADVTRRLTREEGLQVFDPGDGEPTGPNDGQGVDDWSGHGFVRADQAVPAPAGVQIVQTSATVVDQSGGTGSVRLDWTQVGEDSVDEYVVEQRFFNESFEERDRLPGGEGGESFSTTLRNLPVGTHTFRVAALQGDTRVFETTVSETIRGEGVRVSIFPNPFRETPKLSLTLPEQHNDQEIRVVVYDALGRRVATPVPSRDVGSSTTISLSDARLQSLSSGVYFFRVEGETFTKTEQAIHVR